jgi:hypothetical protein
VLSLAQQRGPAGGPFRARGCLSLSLTDSAAPAVIPHLRLSLTPACSLALPWWSAGDRSFGRQTDLTIIIYTTPRFHFARKHFGSSSGDSSPTTVATRRPRCPMTRWYNAVAVKLVRGKRSGAHSGRNEATRRRWEAAEGAGHGKATMAVLRPELGTGSEGCGDPGGIGLAQQVHKVREDAAILLVRLAWPKAA